MCVIFISISMCVLYSEGILNEFSPFIDKSVGVKFIYFAPVKFGDAINIFVIL